MMFYGLQLNWNYRKQRFCNPHFTCVVYGSYNGGAHPERSIDCIFISYRVQMFPPMCVFLYVRLYSLKCKPGKD